MVNWPTIARVTGPGRPLRLRAADCTDGTGRVAAAAVVAVAGCSAAQHQGKGAGSSDAGRTGGDGGGQDGGPHGSRPRGPVAADTLGSSRRGHGRLAAVAVAGWLAIASAAEAAVLCSDN